MFTVIENTQYAPQAVVGPLDLWFNLDPEPRFAVDFEGRALAANETARRAIDDGLIAVNSAGALRFGSTDSDEHFLAALRQIAQRGSGQLRMILRQRDGAWFAAQLHRAPGQSIAVLALRSDGQAAPAAMEALGAAFHLTRSEMQILRCLMESKCPKSVAIELEISEHTVRAHLRSLYAKMGVRGLANLIRLSCHLLL